MYQVSISNKVYLKREKMNLFNIWAWEGRVSWETFTDNWVKPMSDGLNFKTFNY